MKSSDKALILKESFELLLKNSKFISFHRYKIEVQGKVFVLLNPGVPKHFNDLKSLCNELVVMLDEQT